MSGAPTATQGAEQPVAKLQGQWRVEFIGERGVVDNSPARFTLSPDGKINGNASCNRFFGQYQQDGHTLSIKNPLGVTKMLCIPALNEQESRLLALLPGDHHIAVSHGILTLSNSAGEQVLRASKVSDAKQ
jgi:heat shock protein HslJ